MNRPATVDVPRARTVGGRDAHARDARFVAQHFVDRVVPDDVDRTRALPLEQVVLQDLLGAQLVAAMDQRDVRGDVGQVQRFLDRRVAAADDRDTLAAEEEAVAGGAGRDAAALELFLGLEAQVLRARTRRDDQRVAGVIAAIALQQQRALAEVHLVDVVHQDFGVEALGVFAHAFHQARAGEAVRVAGPVVDLGRRHELAALFHARDQQRLAIGPRCIDCR